MIRLTVWHAPTLRGTYEAIEVIAAHGITAGCTPDGKAFCPTSAVFVHRLLTIAAKPA